MESNYSPFPGFVTVDTSADLATVPSRSLTGGCMGFVPNAASASMTFWVYNPLGGGAAGATNILTDVATANVAAGDDPVTAAGGRWQKVDIGVYVPPGP